MFADVPLSLAGFLNANVQDGVNHPANVGILDQIAALHWIQENIKAFGGDPRRVSIMGHGTGAACVHFLMTSEALPEGTVPKLHGVSAGSHLLPFPHSPGALFHRVILMSGSALASRSVVHKSLQSTTWLATKLNCSSQSTRQLLHCLRGQPLIALMDAATSLHHQTNRRFSTTTFGPSFDDVVVHSFRFDIRKYLERMSRYDLLFGVSTADAVSFLNERQLQYGMDYMERNKMISEFVAQVTTKRLFTFRTITVET